MSHAPVTTVSISPEVIIVFNCSSVMVPVVLIGPSLHGSVRYRAMVAGPPTHVNGYR